MTCKVLLAVPALAATLLLAGAEAASAQTWIVNPSRQKPADLTTEQMRAIVPLPLLRESKGSGGKAAAKGTPQIFPGFVPAEAPAPAESDVLPPPADWDGPLIRYDAGSDDSRSKGTSGYPFTTTRVFPDTAVSTAPYRMAGKLLFRDGVTNSWYMCTAAIISYRLVLTAGHCVYNATGKRFYTDFRFTPGYNAILGTQPYGQWTWSAVYTTPAWQNGGGTVPNVSDFGIIEIANQTIGGVSRTIGGYLGYYATATARLNYNHLTALGYPGNIDSGGRMIANQGETRPYGSSSGVMGSSMAGGSSGGPWIEDFGVVGTGQLIANSVANRIVGVTSYGPSGGPSPSFYQGSSILNADFTTMRSTACARLAGNC
jgi:V8-like Glu-specific endopeptidase